MESSDLLKQYVTNTEGQVFAIQNLSGVVGAVFARYSRSDSGLRETLLREFVKEDKLKLKKAFGLIERVLIAYGDDSVGELEGAHLSFEDISLLATKIIEHRRIGGSPIEQSTRYVRYDTKDEEKGYRYFTPENLPYDTQQLYKTTMDQVFDGYAQMWTPLYTYLTNQKPLDSAVYPLGDKGSTFVEMKNHADQVMFQKTWETDLKTKTCDILRAFLPLATRANVGLFGNGRFFQHLLSKMLTSNLQEANTLGMQAFHELSKVIPHYVKRAARSRYQVENGYRLQQFADQYFRDLSLHDPTSLVEPDAVFMMEQMAAQMGSAQVIHDVYRQEQELNFLSALIYPYVRGSFVSVRNRMKTLSPDTLSSLYFMYYGDRQTRRDRPERGIEHGYPYTFDIVSEWAVYKDLMRHRMGTIQYQKLIPDLGFVMPFELEEAGLGDIAVKIVSISEDLFAHLDAQSPQDREYAFLQGHKLRWSLGMNDRALMHMLELRTAPQGHPNYRLCCQELHRLAETRFPERAKQMKFVNHDPIYWSRSDSEARQRLKEERLENEAE